MSEDLETIKESIMNELTGIDKAKYEKMQLFKPQLDKYLKERLNPEPSEKLRDDIVKAIKEVLVRFSPYDMSKHIKIEVNATPREIEEHKMTITYQAIDKIGEEYIRMLNTAKDRKE